MFTSGCSSQVSHLGLIMICVIIYDAMCFSPNSSSPLSTSARARLKSCITDESESIKSLVTGAKDLFESSFVSSNEKCEDLICTAAPGRVNLIGEHTDYTGGFVFPMAIDYSTVCVGTGTITNVESDLITKGRCQIISANQESPKIISFESSVDMKPLPDNSPDFWANYIIGVVAEYMNDFQSASSGDNISLSFQLAINGNVPLGSGLSSSASLEVSVATFIESLISKCLFQKDTVDTKTKALRCQKAENIFCNSPCGIMDQYVSAAALRGSALLIDCRSLDYEAVVMGSEKEPNDDGDNPVFVICNSNVKHSIGGGEYPVRVEQCKEATNALRAVHGEKINSLRDATLSNLDSVRIIPESSKEVEEISMNEIIFRRAKHVITENQRTREAKSALLSGNWSEFGKLMNESHQSMKVDYEVSCEEIDILVDIAQNFDGVYGSRLTGGGFGGCTVTLVKKSRVQHLCQFMTKEYFSRTGKECLCFETSPAAGSREIKLL